MPRAHTAPVTLRVRLGDAIVRNMVLSTAKPAYRGAVAHPGDMSILVALKALSDLAVSVKGLTVVQLVVPKETFVD
jgi:hypothetical protein